MEDMPDNELEDHTKRLRQAFVKANYKKRRLMGQMDPNNDANNSVTMERETLLPIEELGNIFSSSQQEQTVDVSSSFQQNDFDLDNDLGEYLNSLYTTDQGQN